MQVLSAVISSVVGSTSNNDDTARTNLLDIDAHAQLQQEQDDERQTHILSNYSTLRTNLQWNRDTIKRMIDKVSSIIVLPPIIDFDRTVAHREERVLREEKKNIDTTSSSNMIDSSCKSIINYVKQRAENDPLLSDDNPYKQTSDDDEEKKEEMDEDDSNVNEEHNLTIVKSKTQLLQSLDTMVTSRDSHALDKDLDVEELVQIIPDEMKCDPCYLMLQEELIGGVGLGNNRSLTQIILSGKDVFPKNRKKRKCNKDQIKKSLKFTYLVGSRAFSLVDIATDAYLLVTAAKTPHLWYLTLALTISMASPYIISYSSGVQLYLFRQTFDNVEGFKKILMILFLLPTGILYFVFLDLADIFMHLFRWFYFVLCCRTLQEIGQTEQILSEQLGMDRMNWEGFKRQRSIGQLMFESLPQFIFQTTIFYFLKVDLYDISKRQFFLSICSAIINIISTSFKINLEAKCCKSTFISYCLTCIKARVGWVPQREHILEAATKQRNADTAPSVIDYEMSHRPRLLCNIYKHGVEYDFSSTTIRYLMSALQMINNNNNQTTLIIHFRNTLRLLPLQELIELYALCQKKNISIKSLKGGNAKHSYDWSSAIDISSHYGKDAQLMSNARDDQGLPYIMKLMSLTHYSDRRNIFRDLIQYDFDLNIHDLTTNESIVYTLIRGYDYKNLRYILTEYAKNKGVLMRLNYHNKDGISALGVALSLYQHELYVRTTAPVPANAVISPKRVPYLWELLVHHGAELSFPCKKQQSQYYNKKRGDMSPLLYVLAELKDKVLVRHLMAGGAQLYSKEIGLLNELFVNYKLEEEIDWEPPSASASKEEEEEERIMITRTDNDNDDDEWDKDSDFMEHEEDQDEDDSWLALLCDVAKHCHRPIDFITDDEGNNPLHFFINDFNDKNKHKTRSVVIKDNVLRLKRLRHLMIICNRTWCNEKNNDHLYPYQLIIQKRNPDLFFEFANLDNQFKQSIMERKEFVQQMIDWILAITERITKKYPQAKSLAKVAKGKNKRYVDQRVQQDVDVQTLDQLFKPKFLGKLIKWPNKYKKVMNAEEISLIGTALQRELIEVTLYLKEYWKFPVTRTGRDKLKELKDKRERHKLLGIEYNRVRTRYNINMTYTQMHLHNDKSSRKKTGTETYVASNTTYKDRQVTRRNLVQSAPAPVFRQHTLIRMAQNNQLSDVHQKIDVDLMGHIDRIRASHKAAIQVIGEHSYQQHQRSKIETIYSFFVEALSTADFITDILVVSTLIQMRQSWSISLMILFMISPYLVSHSIMCSLIDYRRESIKLDLLTSPRSGVCCHCNLFFINLLALVLMTPAAILWFTFVDVLFMTYLLISTLLFVISCSKIDIGDKMDDLLFKKCLGMSRMQIIGYRRLRTLSQLLFETLPQIALQAYILYYDQTEGGNALDATEIYISICVAALHVVLELFIIYLDARASKMSLSHYAVICLGARLNWVPFAHQIRARNKHNKDAKKHMTSSRNVDTKNSFYNFECVQFQPWFFRPLGSEFMYRIEYEFSPSSIKKLGEYFINLQILSSTDAPSNPYLAPVWLHYYENHTLPVIYLGKTCCRSLDVYSFAEFFRSADKKVTLKSSELDWDRIIFENTPNTSSDNVYLKRLCQEFINYAEVKLITMLAPVVSLSTTDVLLYILDPSQQQSAFNILLILKKYYDENIHFGLSQVTMSAVYDIISNYRWVKANTADPSYSKVLFLLMWFTRRTLYRHQSPRGDLKFTDDPDRETFLRTITEQALPHTFLVKYSSNTLSQRSLYDDGVNKMRTILADYSKKRKVHSQKPSGMQSINENKEEEGGSRGSQSNYDVAADWNEERLENGTYVRNLADEEDDHEVGFDVEFQILECFKFFQPQIERFLIDLTLRVKQNIEILKIGDKALFKFFKKVFSKQSVDFLRLIINSPWNVLQQFPIHVRFAELFSRIDPVVRRLEMVHGYGHYLLASAKYRQSNKSKPMSFTVTVGYDNFDDDNDSSASSSDEKEHLLKNDQLLLNEKIPQSNDILLIQTDPAYHGHTSMRSVSYNFVQLPKQMEYQQLIGNKSRDSTERSDVTPAFIKKKYAYDKSDIMGIARIEISFDVFEVKDTVNIIDEEKGESLGKVELFTILPQKTKIANDKLMLNKVILGEVSFEDLLGSKKQTLIVDLFDNEILGMFRPIYVGRDRIELMQLKLNIRASRPSIQVTCNQIEARITYLLRQLVDATSMKFESVLHKACSLHNLEFIQFIDEYQDIFDCNAVNDLYENALHLLCKMDDPDLEIFSTVLRLTDLDINQIRFDGLTPFELLEKNRNIDIEKKNEMLKQMSGKPSYRPIMKKHDDDDLSQNQRNVLLIGNENSGRHSLFKQLQIHYEKRLFSPWQKSVERSKIIKYMITCMKTLIKHCGDDDIASLVNDDAHHIYSIKTDNLETMEHLDVASFESLNRLWNCDAIYRVYVDNREILRLSDSVRYFFLRVKQIASRNYIPNELDILRSPNHSEVTVLTSKSYRLDDDSVNSDLQIRWILPSPCAHKVLRWSAESYHNVDTVIFMVSLTSFMENDKYNGNDNNFTKSLKLFSRFANDAAFNKTKFVLLFNKTDILRKKINVKDDILMRIVGDTKIDNIDTQDYWDWIDLFQAMFRYQHPSRTVFSYLLSAADPAKIRSILKELEDIIVQKNIPYITNTEIYKKRALLSVKWIAVLKRRTHDGDDEDEKELKEIRFDFDLRSVSPHQMQEIDAANNIDYNAMLYKTVNPNKKHKKMVHFLISMDITQDDGYNGFVWAKWDKTRRIATYNQAQGHWVLLNQDDDEKSNKLNDLNGILASLHHKTLRTQFDGFTMNQYPIAISFESDSNRKYNVSWWNMARMTKCNAITVDSQHYLHFKSPLSNQKIEWNWYDNDSGKLCEYDDSSIDQLEASYQANLQSNFPQTLFGQRNKHQSTVNDDRIFNHCILTDLQSFMQQKHQQENPSYVLRFGFNQNLQIGHITQLRIYSNKNNFPRDVQRRYNGRNSTWPS